MNEVAAQTSSTSPPAIFSMFALGCFVGGTLVIGFSSITASDYVTKLTFAFGAAFTGPVFTLISYFGGQKAIGDGLFAYPVGLLMALLWWYASIAVRNVQDANTVIFWLGVLHFLALIGATIVAFLIYVWPMFFLIKPALKGDTRA